MPRRKNAPPDPQELELSAESLDAESSRAPSVEAEEEVTFDLQAFQLEFLRDEGFRPVVDEDGDIVFKAEGRPYVLFNTNDDPELFRLGAVNIWPISDPDEEMVALRAASEISARFKVAKAFVTPGPSVFVTVEFLSGDPTAFTQVFGRALSILQSAVSEFRSDMQAAQQTPVAKA